MAPKVGLESRSSSFESFSNSLSDSEDSDSEDSLGNNPILLNPLPKGKEVEGSQPARPQLVLPAQEAPADETFTIEATRPRVHVEIYALHGGKFRQDAGVTDDIEHTVEITFSQFKSALVALNICTDDQKVDIDVDNRIVWICNEDGTGVVSKDLNTLFADAPASPDAAALQADPSLAKRHAELVEAHNRMIASANALKDVAKQVWPNAAKRPDISAGRKAPENAPPMRLGWVASQGIVTEVAPCAKQALKLYEAAGASPAELEKALKRMMAAESMINSIQKGIKDALVNKEEVLRNARASDPVVANDVQIAEAAVVSLKKHAAAHRLGLYVALAFTSSYDLSSPEAALASADQAAAQIQVTLQQHLDEKHDEMVNEDVNTDLPEMFPDFIRGTPKSGIPKDETYAKWAAELAYSQLSDELIRMGVSNYRSREQNTACKDGIEHELVRFIVRKELDASAVVTTPLLDEMHADIARQSSAFAAAHTLQSLKDGVAPILAPAPAAAAGAPPAVETTMDARVEAMAAQYNF